ncbi:MAG: DUF2958 domain-containing protein [Planctomycetes bacterium]|nr:DUF2958 domain-containing protein [Planctomycetota bacterium]MBC8373159.1 DUF2958 domain-containing protein [Planctomycetota bacterium]
MNIIPDEILLDLPAIGSTDGQGADAVALVKLFTPWGSWSWYLTEASRKGDDVQMFGLVDGHEKELGYVSLSELMSVRGPMGLAIERDLFWSPKKLGDIAPELFATAQPAT